MIIVDLYSIDSTQYKKLIQHILGCCDEISFQCPGVYSDGKPLPDYERYHAKIQPLIKQCLFHGGRKEYSRDYQGMHMGHFGKIVYVKPFPEIKHMLMGQHLFDWLFQNDLPEDVCFYSQKKLRFFTCSHEEEFFIENEEQKDIDFLRQNLFQFWCCKDRK